MSKRYMVLLAAVVIAVGLVAFIGIRRWLSRRVNHDNFAERWLALQKSCGSRKTWPAAIREADNLLDEALKRRGYKGKTTGERLVSAQHRLSSNSTVWFGHKLSNKIASEDVRKLKKQDVLNALSGFREALRDLGVLKRD